MNRKIIITPEGYLILKKKIARLEEAKKETAQRLSLAGLDSDLSENSDFLILDAKNQDLHKQIEEDKNYLERAKIVQKSKDKSLIGLGSIVIYKILNTGEEKIVEMTDAIEANPPKKISIYSPLGENLLGRKVGDIFNSHGGDKYQFQILEIK